MLIYQNEGRGLTGYFAKTANRNRVVPGGAIQS